MLTIKSPRTATRAVDVLIVGAGQAGLAAARAVTERGVACVVHERHPRIGDSWRRRFDSLVLFTPRRISTLPGLDHEGDPRGYPGKDEMGDYLERYAKRFSLPVVAGNGVARLTREQEHFRAELDDGSVISSRAVVVAIGTFQRPRVPGFASRLAPHVLQLDAASYRNPAQIRGRRVLIVGDGATGRQIALELAPHYSVILATGRRRNFGFQRLFGTDTTELALRTGLLTADKASVAGRLVRALDLTPGLNLQLRALRRAGIEVMRRCVDAEGQRVTLADGSQRDVDAVIYAAGYVDDTTWVDIPGATEGGRLLEHRGISPVPGLYYVGRDWQTSRASGLVCGVAYDAEAIGARLSEGATFS
ncbi:MAG TPA: NAD(P)/FAD-dependent oxidoreductase [Gammaproteobacteria bacterium]